MAGPGGPPEDKQPANQVSEPFYGRSGVIPEKTPEFVFPRSARETVSSRLNQPNPFDQVLPLLGTPPLAWIASWPGRFQARIPVIENLEEIVRQSLTSLLVRPDASIRYGDPIHRALVNAANVLCQ